MLQLKAYHRPESVAAALELLGREGVDTAILAGGTQLVPDQAPFVDEVVDLQAAGLDRLEPQEGQLLLGAMLRVQALVDAEEAPSLLREMARREGPNTFRNQGTIGGAIVTAEPESELLAALLVYDAVVTVETPAGAQGMPLRDFLADVEAGLRGGLLISVTVPTGGETAHARVARTPQDTPIVAALARRDGDNLTLALCGVAETPVLVDPAELDGLQPPADFRGSSEYRREMAKVLAERVIESLQSRG